MEKTYPAAARDAAVAPGCSHGAGAAAAPRSTADATDGCSCAGAREAAGGSDEGVSSAAAKRRRRTVTGDAASDWCSATTVGEDWGTGR